MGGDNYFVDMYGIQWCQDEHNILFPEKDDNEEPDVLEINTLVCMEEEDDVTDQEEDILARKFYSDIVSSSTQQSCV